jgi:hypothetical protein
MLDDDYFYLPKAFDTPSDYTIPLESELLTDTQHPEWNSTAYFNLSLRFRPPKDFLPVFSLIECTEDIFVVGTNDFTSPVFDGNFIGSKNFDTIATHAIKETSFLAQQNTTVTGLKFLDNTMVSKQNLT